MKMKKIIENVKCILLLDTVIFCIIYVLGIIFSDRGEFGFPFLIAVISVIYFDGYLLITSIKIPKFIVKLWNFVGAVAFYSLIIYFICINLIPMELPNVYGNIACVAFAIIGLHLTNEFLNEFLEYNIPKSAQHPTSEGENVR